MTLEVDLSGRRYLENRDTTAVLAGSRTRVTSFTERWTMSVTGDAAPAVADHRRRRPRRPALAPASGADRTDRSPKLPGRMVPIKDNIDNDRFPLVTTGLILANVVVYVLAAGHGGSLISGPDAHELVRYGATPHAVADPSGRTWVTVFTLDVRPRVDRAARGQHAVPVDLRQHRRGLDGAGAVPRLLRARRAGGAGGAGRDRSRGRADGPDRRRRRGDLGGDRRLHRALSPRAGDRGLADPPVLHGDRDPGAGDAGAVVRRAGRVRGRRAHRPDRRGRRRSPTSPTSAASCSGWPRSGRWRPGASRRPRRWRPIDEDRAAVDRDRVHRRHRAC